MAIVTRCLMTNIADGVPSNSSFLDQINQEILKVPKNNRNSSKAFQVSRLFYLQFCDSSDK